MLLTKQNGENMNSEFGEKFRKALREFRDCIIISELFLYCIRKIEYGIKPDVMKPTIYYHNIGLFLSPDGGEPE